MKSILLITLMLFFANVASATCVSGSSELQKTNEVTCHEHVGPASIVFNVSDKPKIDYLMYISSEMAWECPSAPSYYWERLDETGNVVKTSQVKLGEEIAVVAGNVYQLRVDLGDLTECPFYQLFFTMESL